jgi:hypothetical protein
VASRQGGGSGHDEPTGATEPITLTDPDGAVTRVAPWSSWTREQIRAPGGEPALVTRLESGQLWFSAGRRRSPWRHEVHVGPAVVSTPRGRFQATAEPDGGATIACLAGRTRVVAGLREPVVLGPDQSAAVSSDGRTLVVMDRPLAATLEGAAAEEPEVVVVEVPELASVATNGGAEPTVPARRAADAPPVIDLRDADEPDEPAAPAPAAVVPHRPIVRLGWLPELVAIGAIVGLLLAVIIVFFRRDSSGETAAPPVSTTVTLPVSTAPPTTATTVTSPPTTAPTTTPTTAPTTTTVVRPGANGAVAVGSLTSCRRAEGGVAASARIEHRSGPASRFRVTVGLVDGRGQVFAQEATITKVIPVGGSLVADVVVPIAGRATGSCELLGVISV